jgi:hypothetical protein
MPSRVTGLWRGSLKLDGKGDKGDLVEGEGEKRVNVSSFIIEFLKNK